MYCTTAGRASSTTGKQPGSGDSQAEMPLFRARSKDDVSILPGQDVQGLPRTQLDVPDAGEGSDVTGTASSPCPASHSRRDHASFLAEKEAAQTPQHWALSVARSGPPVSVTRKAIYDEDRKLPPFCLYQPDDLYVVNRFIRSCAVQYMSMNEPSRYADIRQWHEWLHTADTDPSLLEKERCELVRNAFVLMYRNGAPPHTIAQASRQVRVYAQDLALLATRHGNAGWFAYDELVKRISGTDRGQRSLFLRCVTLHMIQSKEIEYAVQPDESGNPTEMIRPVYQQPPGFEQSPVVRELVIKALSSAVIPSREYVQALRDLGSIASSQVERNHEETYLDGLEKLAIAAPTLSERQLHRISSDLTDAYLGRIPRDHLNAEKEGLRRLVAMYSGHRGRWFSMNLLCSDLYTVVAACNANAVFTMAILKRELAKGTIQAQTGLFFTAQGSTLTISLRSHRPGCTLL